MHGRVGSSPAGGCFNLAKNEATVRAYSGETTGARPKAHDPVLPPRVGEVLNSVLSPQRSPADHGGGDSPPQSNVYCPAQVTGVACGQGMRAGSEREFSKGSGG